MIPPVPRIRLATFYFWYYSLLGLLYPFWPLFLAYKQFTALEIGQLLAIHTATRIVSPNLWSWLADRSGQRVQAIRLGSLLGLCCFAGIFWADSFARMALVMGGYSFFWNAVMPQFEAVTVACLHREPQRYSMIRLWGSVGFILTVVLGGVWFQQHIGDFAWAGLLFLLMIWLSSLWLPDQYHSAARHQGDGFWQVLRRRPVMSFLAASFLLQVSHGIYYAFYSLQLEAQGYPRSTVGLFWALSVTAEIGLFLVMHRWMTNWSLWGIYVLSLLLAIVRWLVIGHLAFSLSALLIAQLMHAFTFGACHAVSVEYLRRFFAPAHSGQAQALYSAVSFGAGGAVGALIGGLAWSHFADHTFDVAALISILAAIIAYRGLDHRRFSQFQWTSGEAVSSPVNRRETH